MDTHDFVTKDMTKQKKGIVELDSKKIDVKNNQQQAMLQKTYNVYKKGYTDLMTSTRIKKDSPTMNNVKEAFKAINDFLYEELEIDDGKFEEQLKKVKKLYSTAIHRCDEYLAVHQGKRSRLSKGRYRKRLVEQMKLRAENESFYLESRANALKEKANGTKPLWVNVLAEVRTAQLDLNQSDNEKGAKYNITSIGKGSSTVLKIENKDSVDLQKNKKIFYVKKAEHYWSMDDEYKDVVNSKTLADDNYTEYSQDQEDIMVWLKAILEGKKHNWEDFAEIICDVYDTNIVIQPELRYENLTENQKTYKEILEKIIEKIDDMSIGENQKHEMENLIENNKDFVSRFLKHMILHYSNRENCKKCKIEEAFLLTNK